MHVCHIKIYYQEIKLKSSSINTTRKYNLYNSFFGIDSARNEQRKNEHVYIEGTFPAVKDGKVFPRLPVTGRAHSKNFACHS